MLATPERPFVYGRQGGSVPASFELFTVVRGGTARYVAGNPWPARPPFDEIGVYEWSMPAEVLSRLRDMATVAAAEAGGGMRSRDAGMEYASAWVGGAEVEAEWSPVAAPAAAATLTATVRALLAQGRGHPSSVLRASLDVPASGGTAISLGAGGRHGFRLAWSVGGDLGMLVWLRTAVGDEIAEASSIPARLGRLESVEPRIPPLAPGPDGTVDLAPGRSVRLLVPWTGVAQSGTARLEALVRVAFPLTSLAGRDYMQRGWLMPEPAWLTGQDGRDLHGPHTMARAPGERAHR
jgi:hypothetical protein